MVLVDEPTFLLETAKLFTKTRQKGSVWITIKKCPPPVKKADKEKPQVAMALVRCTDGKKTIGTLINASNVVRFQVQFASLMKTNIDNLKKMDDKKKKDKKPSAKPAAQAQAPKKKGTHKE
uniref:Signal recognition particle 14 kDa protein n=1 Tax=Eutreptiella gymnastica TaxID=73025 RepID=A0A7S1IAR9_9EUGL|mmetsp:Transcript_142908/g.249303  ORF Transcript_142908/g.249303 Transcript_142908/m.249303 type:complete len:121 (+) Transcript_142908:74-436(+)